MIHFRLSVLLCGFGLVFIPLSINADVTKQRCPYSCKTLKLPLSCCSNWSSGSTCFVKRKSKPPCMDPTEIEAKRLAAKESGKTFAEPVKSTPKVAPTDTTIARVAPTRTQVGARITRSVSCWDTTANNICDKGEDKTGDGFCTVDDCLSFNVKELCVALAKADIVVPSCS